jgi:hypothetical protein
MKLEQKNKIMTKKQITDNQPDLFNSLSKDEQQINSEWHKKNAESKIDKPVIFSAIFQPTTLFSLKESNSTNSGAKSVLMPSAYAIKMALLNQILTLEGLELIKDVKKANGKLANVSKYFKFVKELQIDFHICNENAFVVNNSFVKILKPERDNPGFQRTVSFREYVYIKGNLELIFTAKSEEQANFLKKYIHKINYFGKRGSFFQFIEYKSESHEPNVKTFDRKGLGPGILQSYDNFDESVTFEQVNNYSSSPTKRKQEIKVIPVSLTGTSKGFSIYKPFT